jgi:hypothetical protein
MQKNQILLLQMFPDILGAYLAKKLNFNLLGSSGWLKPEIQGLPQYAIFSGTSDWNLKKFIS